ncbi:hypothetical protein [Phytohabitans rumicis]|uniref:Uncharacterized protein n=1 Tax=Phytohabitans rumicis TaxID=1076125 RepID=A0A6V8LI33_9ACTN|nr:hypothetical protein [Phytohabitans rumicis]GFJ94309.1 hypothetical protein Prum_079510 [Phytohabitans rumicis]
MRTNRVLVAAALVAAALSGCSGPDNKVTLNALAGSCTGPDSLATQGLLSQAEAGYKAVLATKPPTDRPNEPVECVAAGQRQVAQQRAEAAWAVDRGDNALAAGDYQHAHEWYALALSKDAGNTDAVAGLRHAVALSPGPGKAPYQRVVPWSARAEIWDARRNAWLPSLVPPALVFAVVFLVLVVLARTITRWVPTGPRPKPPEVGLQDVVFVVAAAALCAAASVLHLGFALVMLALAAPLAAFGGYWLADWFALRMRMRVEVFDAEGAADGPGTAYFVGRLSALGSDPPRGLEIPLGTDMTDLPIKDLTTLPGGKWVSMAVKALELLAPSTPWHAKVSIVDKDTAAVELRRNGHLVEAITIDRATLTTAPAKDRDLLTAAAAFVLLHLAKAYTSLEVGLNGASRWRSLAQQVLASEAAVKGRGPRAVELYARAVREDPGNQAARLGYLIARFDLLAGDKPSIYSELGIQLGTMESAAKPYPALHLRVLYARTAAYLNCASLANGMRREAAWDRATGPAVRLVDSLAYPPSCPGGRPNSSPR